MYRSIRHPLAAGFVPGLLIVVLAAYGFAATPDRTMNFSQGHDLVFGGPATDAAKSAVVDTQLILGPWGSGALHNGQFQTPAGHPAWNGWTSLDRTQPTEHHWQVSDYHRVSGSYSAWCGDLSFPVCETNDPDFGGYGNHWKEILEWRGTVDDPGLGCTVDVAALVNYDTEAGYDWCFVSVEQGGQTVNLWTQSGEGLAVPLNLQTTYLSTEYEGDGQDEVVVRFRFTSDGAWSDEDCLDPSAGAWQIDDVSITLSNGPDYSHDFEDGTFGDLVPTLPVGVGNFAKVWPGLQVADGFENNFSPKVAFIDDGLVVPGTGGTACLNWCYGPGGYVVNHTGGLVGPPDGHLDNSIRSPLMAWPGPGYEGANFDFDVWRHEVFAATSAGVFFSWDIRSTADPDSSALLTAPWRSRNFLFYGGPDWARMANPVGDLIEPDARWVQVALSAFEYGFVWGINGSDGTPAPYFDNIRLAAHPYHGPALSATVTQLPHDNFPAGGVLDTVNLGNNSVRFDMGQPPYLWNQGPQAPGDSVVITVEPQRNGAVLVGPPRLHWRLQRNPLFDPYRSAGFPDVGTMDGTQVIGGGGQPQAGRFQFDLPDAGFLFPGDLLYYYFAASDQVPGGELQTAILPADTTGYSNFDDPMAYPPIYKLHALPTLTEMAGSPGSYELPDILFWDDAGAVGNRDEWYQAFANLGLVAGRDYDIYYTNNPSVQASHGLGGRASVAQIAGYDVLLYTSGVQTSNTLTDGANGGMGDQSDDVGLLLGWFALGGKDMLLTGDDLVGEITRTGTGALQFITDWAGVELVNENVLDLIGANKSPTVRAMSGNGVINNVDEWIGMSTNISVSSGYYGAGNTTTGNRRYDAVVPRPGAVRLAEFLTPEGAAGAYPYSAATLNVRAAENARLISFPCDFQSIWTPDGSAKIAAPLPARVRVLEDILAYFGLNTGQASDVPEAATLGARHYPNPFNPAVEIAYTMPQAGHLSLAVYDLRGRMVRSLVDERRPAGPGTAQWDGRDRSGQAAAAGVYFYKLSAGDGTMIGKMALVK